MLSYSDWKLINEAFGTYTLGLRTPQTMAGPIGSVLQEDETAEDEEMDDEEESDDTDEELDGEELDDEEGVDDEEDFGSDFPPEAPNLGGGGMGDEEGPAFDPDMVGSELADLAQQFGIELGGEEGLGDEEIDPADADELGLGGADDDIAALAGLGGEEMPADMDAETPEDEEEEDFADEMRSYMGSDKKKCKMKKCGKFMGESDDSFLNTLSKQAKGEVRQKFSDGMKSGLQLEDALFAMTDPNQEFQHNEPQPGEVGFAPQQKLNTIGGGYTMDDFDLPTVS